VYEFDDSRWPLVVIRVREYATPDVTEQMRLDLDAMIDRGESFAILFDITDVEIPPRDEVMAVLKWTRTMREKYVRSFEQVEPRIPTFTAYHMPSMLGNLLRFILQMVPSIRSQHVVCTSFDEALAACEEAIVRLGLDHAPARRVG
jgi:hypothetical protein